MEERMTFKMEDLTKNVKVLMEDYDKRCLEDNWERELRKIVDSAKDFLRQEEALLDFSIYMAERFIEHVTTSVHVATEENFDYIYERGNIILQEVIEVARRKLGGDFIDFFFEDHIKKALDYSAACEFILKDKFNDKKRRMFIESAKFLQVFLTDIHKAYYKMIEGERDGITKNN